MSSPPTNQAPYYPAPLNNPRKRPLGPSVNTNGPDSAKRRKPSTLSALSSGHPLRQASFPPPDNVLDSRQSSFSPPISTTGRSSVIGSGKRGRGGRKKAADARSQAGTSAAGTATKAGSTAGKGSVVNGAGQDAGEEEDAEEDEEDAQDAMLESGAIPDEAQLKLEKQHLRMLVDAFDPEQAERYDMWRRVKLNKAVVRRLVNQTLSQSVAASIVTAVNGYTKLFAGELIERACEVQIEWLASSPTLPTEEPNPNYPRSEPTTNGADKQATAETNGDAKDTSETRPVSRDRSQRIDVKEMDKGPLTPDHLREALRRYKRDREGEGTGYQGLSLYGRANTASRTGGKRMFR